MIETFLFLYEWRLTKLTGGNYGAGHHVWSISLSDLEETYYVRLKSFDLTRVRADFNFLRSFYTSTLTSMPEPAHRQEYPSSSSTTESSLRLSPG